MDELTAELELRPSDPMRAARHSHAARSLVGPYRVIAFIALSFSIITTALAPSFERQLLGLVAVAAVVLALVPARAHLIASPLGMVGALVISGTAIKLSYIALFGASRSETERRFLNGGELGQLTTATIWVLLAVVALYAGFFVSKRARGVRLPALITRPTIMPGRAALVSSVLVGLGLVGFALFATSSDFSLADPSTWSQKRFNEIEGGAQARTSSTLWLFFRLALLPRLALYLLMTTLLTSRASPLMRARLTRLAWIAGTLAVAVPLFANNRAGIAILALDIGLLAILTGRSIDRSKLLATVGVATGLIVAALVQRSTSNRTLFDVIEQTLTGRDLMDISKIAVIIDRVPEHTGYLGGESLVGWLAAPIPGTWLSNKPLWADLGPLVYQDVYGLNGISGIPASLFGELWLNFGGVGLLLGSLLFGAALRIVWNSFSSSFDSPVATLIYVLIAVRFTVFTLGNDLGTGILKAALDVLPVVALLWFCSSRKTSPRPVSGRTPAIDRSTVPA